MTWYYADSEMRGLGGTSTSKYLKHGGNTSLIQNARSVNRIVGLIIVTNYTLSLHVII